jgi:hypothetical protein
MMRKLKWILCFTGGLVLHNLQAQESPVGAGGDATGAGGSVSYSVGQVVYITYTGSNGSVAQGVQQPYEISTSGIDDLAGITLEIAVYPNPTTSFVNLKIKDVPTNSMCFLLVDLNGQQILTQKIDEAETQIPMEELAPAIYFLHVLENNKTIKTFKIIKNNL